MPPSRDDETEVTEQATLAARYYQALLAQGVGLKAAQQFTVAWILGKQRADAEKSDPLGDFPG